MPADPPESTGKPMVGVGLVGLGYMAATHLKAYRRLKGYRIAALCNPSGRNLDGDFSQVDRHPGPEGPIKLDMRGVRATRDFGELLADPAVELIDVCAPTPAHPELVTAALRAGKHVVCEKPLARTSAIAREIAGVASASTGFLMPAMCLRFWPEYVFLKQAVEDGRFGRLLALDLRRIAEAPGWGEAFFLNGGLSGGALLDLHIHDADFVQYCLGCPRVVYSRGLSRVSGAIDHVVTQFRVDSEAVVSAQGSWAMTPGFGFKAAYTALFEQATVEYDSTRGADALRLIEPRRPARTLVLDSPDGYTGELEHLLESITLGRPPAGVTPMDAVRAIQICEAEEQSIQTGAAVTVSGG